MDLKLSKQEEEDLKLLQRSLKERWAYVRVTSVLMLSRGYSALAVSDLLGIDDNSVYRYAQGYRELGIEGFLIRNAEGFFGKLDCTQLGRLSSRLRERLFLSAQEVCDWVCSEFGISYTESGMAKLLHRLGFSYKKTKQVPCEANAQKQTEFLEGLKSLLESPESAIYYLDAVHPTHNTRSLYAWIPKGEDYELPTVSGRDRVNINGALNAHDPSEVIIHTGERINAQNTKELYQKIIDANPEKERIYAIADNARYYKNKELREWVETTKIVQVFLPAYSPNLNLIERLWKFMRKVAIDPIFYRTKDEFRAGILSFFENIAQYEDELKTLLTLNFRVLNSQINFR